MIDSGLDQLQLRADAFSLGPRLSINQSYRERRSPKWRTALSRKEVRKRVAMFEEMLCVAVLSVAAVEV